MALNRRQVISQMMALGAVGLMPDAWAGVAALPAPMGVQLWMFHELLEKDFEGTLAKLPPLGIREIELAGAYGRSPADLKRILADHGLTCVGAHVRLLQMTDDEVATELAFCQEAGIPWMVAPIPASPAAVAAGGTVDARADASFRHDYSADDWAWNANRLNQLGRIVSAGGLRFAYHNHNLEFAVQDGLAGYGRLLRDTDPSLVAFEMDAGNLSLSGADPLDYLAQHKGRFKLAHVKNWQGPIKPTGKLDYPPSAPFGDGALDWTKLLPALKAAGVQHYFIEQEGLPPAGTFPALQQGLAYFAGR